MRPFPPLATLSAVVVSAACPLAAQCASAWLPGPSARPDSTIFATVAWDPDGAGPQPAGVAVGGSFTAVGGAPMRGVAFYDPETRLWSSLPGMPPSTQVRALAVLPNGDLIAGGMFYGAGGVADNIARWNGAVWTSLGAGVGNRVDALLVLPNGDLIAGGSFYHAGGAPAIGIARWNGTSWTSMPGLGPLLLFGIHVEALARRSNGDIVAGGGFECPGGGNLAVWDGSAWAAVSPASGLFVLSLRTLANDTVAVGTIGGISVWDGVGLQGIGSTNASVRSLLQLPNGDLLAAGDFAAVGTLPVQHIARWNGAAWSALGGGAGGSIYDLEPLADGDLLASGDWTGSAILMERLTTTCPATVTSYGSGCAGAGGLDVLEPTTLPWIGATFRARATGMPGVALVLSVYGFTQLSIPFPTVIPEALPGCTVLMSGDRIDVLLPSAGAVETAVALPNSAAAVGGVFHHYVVPFEFDAVLGLIAVTNSNALTCTIGAF